MDPALSLHRRFLAAWLGIAALIVLDHAVIQPELSRISHDAPVINVAGRQRMLSQKLVKTALVLAGDLDPDHRTERERELEGILELWTRSHRGLQAGDSELRLPGRNSPAVTAAFDELRPVFEAMQAAADELLSDAAARDLSSDPIRRLLTQEPRFLEQMHAIVGIYETEARQRVTWLERTGWTIAAGILLAMGGLAWFAIRPAAERLARQYRQSQRQCATLANQLAHADRLKSVGEIAAGIAHEVNQPLGAIANYAEGALARIAAGTSDAGELTAPLQRMLAAALKAGQVIRRVKRFAQNRPHVVQTASLNDLVRETLDLFEPELQRHDIRVTERFDAGEPACDCDALQVSQVLTNLVQNSMRALETVPTNERWLTITTGQNDDSVWFSIRDTGPGMEAATLSRLFQPFSTNRPEGLGMGLSISRSIVEGHGGSITGSNGDYGGAVFTVRLPKQAVELATLAATEARHA